MCQHTGKQTSQIKYHWLILACQRSRKYNKSPFKPTCTHTTSTGYLWVVSVFNKFMLCDAHQNQVAFNHHPKCVEIGVTIVKSSHGEIFLFFPLPERHRSKSKHMHATTHTHTRPGVLLGSPGWSALGIMLGHQLITLCLATPDVPQGHPRPDADEPERAHSRATDAPSTPSGPHDDQP